MALSVQDFYRSSNGNRWQLVRDQGALSWELRAATSLALLLRDQGRFGPGPTPTSAGPFPAALRQLLAAHGDFPLQVEPYYPSIKAANE
jgi:hypothetical protein